MSATSELLLRCGKCNKESVVESREGVADNFVVDCEGRKCPACFNTDKFPMFMRIRATFSSDTARWPKPDPYIERGLRVNDKTSS